jgi:hypothetical protein
MTRQAKFDSPKHFKGKQNKFRSAQMRTMFLISTGFNKIQDFISSGLESQTDANLAGTDPKHCTATQKIDSNSPSGAEP